MQKLFLTIIVIIALGFTPPEKEKEVYEPIVVLELFTSQGCSSCPSADALLDKVKNEYKDANVFTLSYHVDYWNYIGWKDPFSNETYTYKQKLYNAKFGSGRIYTPQVVVNGKEHFVGSDTSKMQNALDYYLKRKISNSIKLTNSKKEDDEVKFDYSIQGSIENKKIRVALVLDQRETYVTLGENRRRTLRNTNIVIDESTAPLDDEEGSITVKIPETVLDSDSIKLIALVEDGQFDITAAAKLDL